MKRIFALLPLFLAPVVLLADDNKKAIAIKAQAEYGYNYAWRHYGTLAVSGYFPINDYFDLSAGVQANTANVYAVDGRAIVNFPLKVGRLSLENRFLYRAFAAYDTHELNAAVSVGYAMNYFRVSAGFFGKLYGQSPFRSDGDNVSFVTEPFNLLWNIEAHVRPDSCVWNLGIRATNFDDFQIERFNQPIFTLLGRYDIDAHWRVWADVACKPTGMFHVTANFYAINTHIGFIYTW